jgi:hypothetical protein
MTEDDQIMKTRISSRWKLSNGSFLELDFNFNNGEVKMLCGGGGYENCYFSPGIAGDSKIMREVANRLNELADSRDSDYVLAPHLGTWALIRKAIK